jgi:valyl-tRNA synthetase
LAEQSELIAALARLDSVTEVKDGYGLHLTDTPYDCWLDIDQQTAKHFLVELERKRDEQERSIKQLEERLANKNYVKNAPKAIVEQTHEQLAEAKAQLAKVTEEHQRFAAAQH